MTTDAIGVNPEHLQAFLDEHGPSLGLDEGGRSGLAVCWAQHPEAVHDLVGLYLAWSALISAFNLPVGSGAASSQLGAPGPRDWLDLSNASAPAIARAIASTATCQRAGHHIREHQVRAP
ncbi:MAG: hypothetical protein PHU75_09960 [Candidatus Nanopelagicales bacterium]|nr:hypothetical protein [Candidatus Nanopelagicales bacterium]